MATPQFINPELNKLFQDLGEISHPEHPFLNRDRGKEPMCDLTGYIAEWLETERIEAVRELWGYITGSGVVEQRLFEKALSLSIPEEFCFSLKEKCEIRAIVLLSLRTDSDKHMLFDAAGAISTLLASSVLSFSEEAVNLINQTLSFETKPSETRSTFDMSLLGKTNCEYFSYVMRQLPPMVRFALSRSIGATDDYWKVTRFRNGSNYGCSDVLARMYVNATQLFEPDYNEGADIPQSASKDLLQEILSDNGISFKKSDARKTLINEVVRNGLSAIAFTRAEPDRIRPRLEYKEEAFWWSKRCHDLFDPGWALLSILFRSLIPLRNDISEPIVLADAMEYLIHEAFGWARYSSNINEWAISATPCRELVVYGAASELSAWQNRWWAFGGHFFEGRMIARILDPIWSKINKFGHPWEPFDFGSYVSTRDVGFRESKRLGVIP